LNSNLQAEPYTKRHFLDCRSLAEMAITWVVLSVMFAIPAAVARMVLRFAFDLPESVSHYIPLGLWLLSITGMWLWFARLGRTWQEPRLATREFFYFQVAEATFILLLAPGAPWEDAASPATAIRSFLSALFVTINLAYVTLAWGIRLRLPAKVLIGLVLNITAALLPLWTK
jgi:hypothetical protein